jgi:hypothetical protein
MAGDEIVMGLGTQLMIHDAWGLAVGNAETMADTAARLSKLSDGYAGIYAERTNRPAEEMRELMRAEAWLNADEAIEQGFADRKDERDAAPDAKALAGTRTWPANATAGQIMSDIWGEMQSALQTSPAEPVDGKNNQPDQEVVAMAEATDTTTVETGSPPESPPTTVVINHTPAASAVGEDQYLAEITRLSTQVAEMQKRESDREKAEFFGQVLAQGRISPAERAEYEALYDAAPEQTRSLLLARAVGSAVPVAPVGHEGTAETSDDDANYARIFGTEG